MPILLLLVLKGFNNIGIIYDISKSNDIIKCMSKKSILKIETTTIHVRFVKFKQQKAIRNNISKELMPAAWQPTRWWEWCMPEDNTKESKSVLGC